MPDFPTFSLTARPLRKTRPDPSARAARRGSMGSMPGLDSRRVERSRARFREPEMPLEF
jgi:hypothetical protein